MGARCRRLRGTIPRDANRDVDPHRAAYLTHLHALGHTRAAVEQRIIDNTDPTRADARAADDPGDELLTAPADTGSA